MRGASMCAPLLFVLLLEPTPNVPGGWIVIGALAVPPLEVNNADLVSILLEVAASNRVRRDLLSRCVMVRAPLLSSSVSFSRL